MTEVLGGIKVVDLTEDVAGPYCSMHLGDLGAEIIKVEGIEGDTTRQLGPFIKGESSLFMSLNRNKKSIAVDYNKPQGKEIVYQLARNADIFIESFDSCYAEKLGLGYEDIVRYKSQVVYCSISSFGETGPYKNRPASELELQGMAGFTQYLGEMGEEPVRVGVDVAAMGSGLHAMQGILAALYYRRKTGIGQKVEISAMRSMIQMGCYWIQAFCNPDTYGGWFFTGPYDHAEHGYATLDRPIVFSVIGRVGGGIEKALDIWVEFLKRVGLGELLEDPWFKYKGLRAVGLGRDAQEMKPLFETYFADKKSEDMINMIDELGGMGSAIYDYETLFGGSMHPQVQAVDMIKEIEHPVSGKTRVLDLPLTLSDTPAQIKCAAPTLGQHTTELLSGLGYSEADISRLKKNKIVA
ncbi:MAG: CoA transferase [Dehalococcoidia bacterium]|jgi:crotonobetainyl-CoA:carnitine CoA-transferase CaiB-like acyl-CoA transferase